MNKKIIYVYLFIIVLNIIALALSLNGWVDMNYYSNYSSILNKRIIINAIALFISSIEFLFLVLLFLKRKTNINIKFVYKIISIIFLLYIDIVLMINAVHWIREGYVFSEIIILNAFSFVLVSELIIYGVYNLIKNSIINRQSSQDIDKTEK